MIGKINAAFKNIYFLEEGHKYLNIDTGEQLTSVTTYKKKYMAQFEGKQKDYWLNRKAIEAGITTAQMQDEWDEKRIVGTTRGSVIHDYAENISNRKVINPELNITGMAKLKRFVSNFFHDYPDYINIATELVVGNDKIGGQIDRLCLNKDMELTIIDWKGLALDTKIPTPDGFKLMKDIKVGDKVYDGNGKITKVQHVSEIHYNPCYKLKFNTGDEVIADHEHKWVIKQGLGKRDEKIKEVNTDYIYDYYQSNYKSRLKIENFNNLETEHKDLPLDPYVLGLWLADGNSHDSKITNINPLTWKEILKRGYNISNNLSKDKAETRTVYDIRKHLVSLNVIKNKHIPMLYLRASYQQRLDLLRGLMDGDGHFHKKRNRYSMVTTKEWQANGLKQLVSTFGYNCTIHPILTSDFGKSNIKAFSINFSSDINPFLTRNQDEIKTSSRQQYRIKNRYITSIEKIDTVPTKCISVTSNDKTYLFGEGMIKTHNTDKEFKGSYGKKMKKPYNNFPSDSLHGYYLQVNMYRQLLLEKGFEVKEMKIVHFGINNDNYIMIDVPKIDIVW